MGKSIEEIEEDMAKKPAPVKPSTGPGPVRMNAEGWATEAPTTESSAPETKPVAPEPAQ
jgi:hypothetical protein